MQRDTTDPQREEESISWLHWLMSNLRIVIFLVLAFAGMIWVYWFFSPAEATAEILATTGSQELSAPFYKAAPDNPVVQRLTQSPGPLRIGIISGHKGFDSGAVCDDGLTEASVNQNIAEQVVARLQADGVPVDLLDEFDARLGKYGATAVVSIHADSCVYYHDQLTGYKLAPSSRTESAALEACVEAEYGRITQMPYHAHTITEHMTDYHVFRELPAGVPAVIIEVGFLNLDRNKLVNESDVLADGVYSGIRCYLDALGVR